MEVKMSPNMKKHAPLAASILCAFALWNCGNESSDTNAIESNSEMTNVSLSLQYSAPPLLDSLVLDCYGADTLHYVHSADNPHFNMDLFPSDNWRFDAKIYANGALMQRGELETKLSAGSVANLSIQMHPIVGFVVVDVPLGLKNENGIASGLMTLESGKTRYEIPMEETTGGIVFKSGMLKLGKEYDVQISLYDSAGNEIYKLTDKFLLTEDSPVPNLTLNSLRSQVTLSVTPANERLVEITLPLKAGYRKPRANDLLITEFYTTAAKSDSSQYEFIEIYNGSIDTLILDDCSIGATNSGFIRYLPLTISEIAPQQAIVIGDATKDITPPNHINTESWNDITNTKGSIVLKCDGATLDSLYYATDTDSLHANVIPSAGSKNNISTQLNLAQWENRIDSTAWYLGKPTPGEVATGD